MTGVSARTDELVRALLCQLIRLWRCRTISKQELQINEEIRDKELRVIDSDGTQLGIMPLAAAQKIAVDRNLDLVKIAPQATPPVCRVMDYGKYRFEESKREREARKNQKTIEVKEIRLSLNIDTHDLEVKAKNAKKFLAAGNKLKIAIRFRGREMAYPQIGRDLMNKFVGSLSEYGTVDKPPKMEGRSMVSIMTAKPAKPVK